MLVGYYSGQTLKVSFAGDDGVKTDVSCDSLPDFIEKNHKYLSMKFLPLREKEENLTTEIMEIAEFFKRFLSGLCALPDF